MELLSSTAHLKQDGRYKTGADNEFLLAFHSRCTHPSFSRVGTTAYLYEVRCICGINAFY